MKKILAVTCLVFLLMLSSCQKEESEPINASNGTLTIGMECGYAPYNWTQDNDENDAIAIDGGQYCAGYDVDMAKKIADDLNKDLIIRKISWEGLILSLQSHEIDAIIAGMSPTAERKKEVDFTSIYYIDPNLSFGIITQKGSSYDQAKTVFDFDKAKVAAQIGTFHMELLDQMPGITKASNFKDFPSMTIALQAGELDAFVTDYPTGASITDSNQDLVYIPLNGKEGFQISDEMAGVSIAVAKDRPDMKKDIEESLAKIPQKERNKMMDKALSYMQSEDLPFWKQVKSIFTKNKTAFFKGTMNTIMIAFLATFFGFLIGLLVVLGQNNPILNAIGKVYVLVFRATPMMVQSILFYYGMSFMIEGFTWSQIPYGNFLAAIIIVSINTGAYMSETLRAGIQSVDKGQFEAAKSLGMNHRDTMRFIIFPQAIVHIIPAIGNEFIVNLKDTSVLNIISVTELFFVSNGIASSTYQIFQTFTITSLIYLLLTSIFTIILHFVERKLDPSSETKHSYPQSITSSRFLKSKK